MMRGKNFRHKNAILTSLEIPSLLFINQRELVWALAKKEVSDRHIGQFFGAAWIFIHPFLTVAVYLFLFGFVLTSKTGATGDSNNHVLYILAGIIPWLALAEVANKSCSAVVSRAALVKQVVFPIDVVPFVTLTTAMISQFTMTTIFLIALVFKNDQLPSGIFMLPVFLLIELLLLSGFAYLLSGIGVFVKDLKEITQVGTSLGIYLLPVVFQPEWVPSFLKPIVQLNPLTYFIHCAHEVFISPVGTYPHCWIIAASFSIFVYLLGTYVFKKLQPNFGAAL